MLTELVQKIKAHLKSLFLFLHHHLLWPLPAGDPKDCNLLKIHLKPSLSFSLSALHLLFLALALPLHLTEEIGAHKKSAGCIFWKANWDWSWTWTQQSSQAGSEQPNCRTPISALHLTLSLHFRCSSSAKSCERKHFDSNWCHSASVDLDSVSKPPSTIHHPTFHLFEINSQSFW